MYFYLIIVYINRHALELLIYIKFTFDRLNTSFGQLLYSDKNNKFKLLIYRNILLHYITSTVMVGKCVQLYIEVQCLYIIIVARIFGPDSDLNFGIHFSLLLCTYMTNIIYIINYIFYHINSNSNTHVTYYTEALLKIILSKKIIYSSLLSNLLYTPPVF